jgi:hypothetical protein
LESVAAPQLTATSRPIAVTLTLGVAPWLTVAAAAPPSLPAEAGVVHEAHAIAVIAATATAATPADSRPIIASAPSSGA